MIKTIKMLIEKGEHLMITFTPKPPDLPVVLAKHCPGGTPRGVPVRELGLTHLLQKFS